MNVYICGISLLDVHAKQHSLEILCQSIGKTETHDQDAIRIYQ